MRHLSSLSVSTSYETWSDPLEPGYWWFLSARVKLVSLDIVVDWHVRLSLDEPYTDFTLTASLPHFPAFRSLNVRGRCDCFEPAFYAALRGLRSLASLTFDEDADYSMSELTRLVDGPAKHPRLTHLELNDDYEPSYKSPSYKQLKEATERGGVELGGSLSEAVAAVKAFAEEEMLELRVGGWETGPGGKENTSTT
ncbi:hypothetical protein JCM8547_006084 [Rhodosporidiobolus lusitaniae]